MTPQTHELTARATVVVSGPPVCLVLELKDGQCWTGERCRNGHYSPRSVATGGCVACARAAARRSYRANRDKQQQRYREFAARKGSAWQRERIAQWRAEHPHDIRAIDINNRVRRLFGIDERVTGDDIRYVFERDRACLRCGSDSRLCIDHVTPLALGGRNARDNLQLLCRSCNAKKWKQATDYRREREVRVAA